MLSMRISAFFFAVAVLFTTSICHAAQQPEAKASGVSTIRVRLTAKQHDASFVAADSITLADGKAGHALPPGAYSVRLSEPRAAKQRFRLFAKTFRMTERDEAESYAAQWKQQGYEPELLTFGKAFKSSDGKDIDGRNLWISIARLETMDKATALKAKLEKQDVWAWIVPETVARGEGQLVFKGSSEKATRTVPAPVRMQSESPVTIRNLDYGFWKPARANRSYSGMIEFEVGPDGLLEIYETLPLEDYLAGVLPAEMPASWPIEALKAQSVSARSEVMASLGGKHMLEGFDFCGTEHCRAYLGFGGHEKTTDKAVAETSGVVLVSGGRILPTVFSANCGGWTEDNECVWAAPPNPALRATPDFPKGKNPAPGGPQEAGMAGWLKSGPQAFCSASKESFRWTRKFTANELKDVVNKKYAVGNIRSIELGDRGKGGRLKWVKIVGSRKTEVIRKELNIRLAFGGLKSAMFILETQGKKGDPTSFVFIGGGRGHGVGLCQDGARGMAQAGANHQSVLRHYFANADLVRAR